VLALASLVMLLTKNRPVLRKNASPVDMLIDLLIPSRFYRFMQNCREGPRRAVIVNDVRGCVGLGHLGRWCHTHIEVIGLIFDSGQERSCCFGVVTRTRVGMTCLMQE
jgi:hypothetical protein